MGIGYRLGFSLGEVPIRLAVLGSLRASEIHGPHHIVLMDALIEHLEEIQRIDRGNESELARVCLALSHYETIVRVGDRYIDSPLWSLPPSAQLEDLLGLARAEWVADIVAVNDAAQAPLVSAFDGVGTTNRLFGPTFTGSADVGGADADFLIGDCLIEVKATIRAACEKTWIHQLAGYALLDYEDRYGIREVGFYLARQAVLVRWPLDEFLRRMSPLDRSRGLSKPHVDVSATRSDLAAWLQKARVGTHGSLAAPA